MMISRTQIDQVRKIYKTGKTTRVVSRSDGLSEKGKQDDIRLSFNPEDIERIKQLVNKIPDIRRDKVEPLAKAVESGDYSVDPKLVADKLMGRLLVDKIR